MFDRLGSLVSRFWLWVLLGWVGLGLLAHFRAPRWDDVTRDGDFAYLPDWMTSVRGERLLEAAFAAGPSEGEALSKSTVILVVARTDGPLEPADYAKADDLVAMADELNKEFTPADGGDGPILRVLSYQTEVVGEKLLISPVGPHGQATLIVIQLRSEFMAVGNMDLLEEIEQRLGEFRRAEDFPPGLRLGITGSAAVGADMLLSGEESIRNTELATVVMVVLILLLVYRAPGLVIVPLVTIVASLVVSTGLVAALAEWSAESGWLDYKIFKTTRIFIVVILYGAGTDFCLFLISRYKEELQRGLRPDEAIAHALGRVGGAVTASAMTTILGLAAMAFTQFGKFRNSGPTIALGLLVALLASLTLAPGLLRAAGPIVFWPRKGTSLILAPGAAQEDYRIRRKSVMSPFSGFWEWLARQVVARPGLILVGSLIVLSPLAYEGLGVEVTYDLLSELQSDRPSVLGTNLLRDYFEPGETGPITVLAYCEAGGLDNSYESRERIDGLAQKLYGLTYTDSDGATVRPVTSVRSLVEPLGEPAEQYGGRDALRKGIVRSRAKSTYLAQAPEYAGKVTRLDLVCGYDPFSSEAIRFLGRLEGTLDELAADPKSGWDGTEFYYLGTTAGIRDLKAVTASDLVLIQWLVPAAVLVVLICILRRPLVSVYLVLSVLFGYYVSIGATELIFAHVAHVYGASFGGLDWKVPMFLFVILVAVGEDYNIYLVTRVAEEQKRLGPIEGLRVALVRTGGIITSCGVIMAGTFSSMTTGTLGAVIELGVALSFGVLLDTFVIRTVLVPVFLVLWERLLARLARGQASGPSRPAADGPT